MTPDIAARRDQYAGPDCTDQSTTGDWCGDCDACRAALAWLLENRFSTFGSVPIQSRLR